MNKKDFLLQTLGGNISESVGLPTPSATPAPAIASRYEGYRRDQASGELALSQIIPDPNQPRKTFGEQELAQLAASIQQHGILQPLRVRWVESLGKWVIITGESRYRAAQRIGLESVPCVLVEEEFPETTLRIQQLVENCQRTDLPPLEQAQALRQLLESTGWSTRELGEQLGLSKASVIRSLALLKLPHDVQHLAVRL